jgi:hypothetical protein
MKVQGLGEDQVGSRRGPHARTIGAQVKIVAVIQGGQGGRQVCLLACS